MATEDFEGFTTGVQPTGWSTIWEGGTWTVETIDLNKVLRCAPAAANSDRALVLDSADGWTDFEVVVRTRQGNADGSEARGGLVFHATGTTSRNGYYVNVALDGNGTGNGDQLVFVRRDANATGYFEVPAFASPIQGWTWIKVRRVGTNIKARAWVDGTPEPATWLVDVTDGTYTTGGIGVFCRGGGATNDPPFDFDNFSVQHYHTASVTLTLNDPASGGSAWASKTGLAVDVSVARDSAPFYSATGQSTNGSGELAIAATACPLAAGTQTVWIRITDSDGLAGGVGNDSNAFYAPVEVTVA